MEQTKPGVLRKAAGAIARENPAGESGQHREQREGADARRSQQSQPLLQNHHFRPQQGHRNDSTALGDQFAFE